MKQFVKLVRQHGKTSILVVIALVALGSPAQASTVGDEQSLRRGSVEDVSPQQRYQSAIREAGGAYKAALRECAQGSRSAERSQCMREAKTTYDSDMAQARSALR